MTLPRPPTAPRRLRRWALALALPVGLGVGVGVGVGAGGASPSAALRDRAVADMRPPGPFETLPTPPAPNYDDDAAWLALPGVDDASDVALPALPRGPKDVDVFSLHPTSSVLPAWNQPHDDSTIREASIRGGTLIQASAFNVVGDVFAPTYRQAGGIAFVEPSADGDRAIDVAFADVSASFRSFLKRRGDPARPFVIAGHSQGGFLAARLLRDVVENDPTLRSRLVAAYLLGAPITAAALGTLAACDSPTTVGCVVTYNARGPDHERNAIDILAPGAAGPPRLCVNPSLGAASTEAVDKARHGGAVFFDADAPALLPAFLASQCRGEVLVVSDVGDIPARGTMSAVLMWVMGGANFHPVEAQIFYADLRADVQRRAVRWAQAQTQTQTLPTLETTTSTGAPSTSTVSPAAP
jgi:hypothetical protein